MRLRALVRWFTRANFYAHPRLYFAGAASAGAGFLWTVFLFCVRKLVIEYNCDSSLGMLDPSRLINLFLCARQDNLFSEKN